MVEEKKVKAEIKYRDLKKNGAFAVEFEKILASAGFELITDGDKVLVIQ